MNNLQFLIEMKKTRFKSEFNILFLKNKAVFHYRFNHINKDPSILKYLYFIYYK